MDSHEDKVNVLSWETEDAEDRKRLCVHSASVSFDVGREGRVKTFMLSYVNICTAVCLSTSLLPSSYN